MRAIEVIFAVLVVSSLVMFMSNFSNYDERMKEYNKYMCANYGKEEDCKTPLPPERRLK